ncbi:MAG: 1,2-phenylacetyl-CoA epoxidase subunit PaaE [Casimicrobiaceae bacterium]
MRWYPLRVAEVRPETEDAVSVRFEVPAQDRAAFAFSAGQFLTLRAVIDGEECRRSYSLCSTPASGEWRIGVKRVAGGRMSNWLADTVRGGHWVDVLPPDGRFTYRPAAEPERLLLIAAGSGITPILAIATTALAENPAAQVTLLYGNRRVRDILFKEEIEDLRDLHHTRFHVIHCLSREAQEAPLNEGRIDAAKLERIFATLIDPQSLTGVYVCGPGDLAETVTAVARAAGVAAERVHRELFTSPGAATPSVAPRSAAGKSDAARPAMRLARVRLTADGITREFDLAEDGPALLDAALAAGADVPFSCKSGVCCTCRAKVLDGQVRMDANWTLEPHEVAAGFVLTCQAHPVSDTLVVTLDER